MPQDPHLYGQRPAKKQKKEIPLSSSLAFTSQLTSLLSSSSSTPTSAAAAPSAAAASSGRPRPSKQKDDLFSVKAKKKRKNNNNNGGRGEESGEKEEEEEASKSLLKKLKTPHGTEDERQGFLRARRNMEEKARRYAAMKRGDLVAQENDISAPLVDFDRKWAERHPEEENDDPNSKNKSGYSSSGSDNESDDDDDDDYGGMNELVEYKDEFGRTRTGTRAEALRQARRERRQQLGAEELEAMAARPLYNPSSSTLAGSPSTIIHGDVIQSAAFFEQQARDATTAQRMEDLAARRDRTPTPPADAHFDGRAEIRSKGVGFYQFSTDDAGARTRQMEELKRQREETERARKGREDERQKRKREIEERRRKIGKVRAERLADSFLDGLAGEFGAGGGGGDGDGAGGAGKDDGGQGGGSEAERAEKAS